MNLLADAVALVAGAGLVQAVAGAASVRSFQRGIGMLPVAARPAVTLLKPLHGDEPMLEAALASLCRQDYGDYQIVFGVQDPRDAALDVVDRVRARFPDRDIVVVVDDTAHGKNRKIANLMNMLPQARHDILVIADSDVHVAPDYLDRIVQALAPDEVGLVTTLYAGLSASTALAAKLGATGISHGFLPGALLARHLGRRDCLGATMALRRETLEAIGGLGVLVNHLADDHMLGRAVQALGLQVRLAATVAATTVPETTLTDLFRHELRWARTVLSLVPVGFALSSIQFPLFWAALAMALSAGADWSVALFGVAWLVRAVVARDIGARLGLADSGLAQPAPVWLLPLRDLMSMAVLLSSYVSDRVEWRGQVLTTGPVPALEAGLYAKPSYVAPYSPAAYSPVSYASAGKASAS